MHSLKTGIYAGYTDSFISNEYIVACSTLYDGLGPDEQMHCHENPHLSFVLSGGNLEKRNGTEIERLPGKTTFYRTGEYHRSTRIANGSRHVNIEIQRPFFKDNAFAESMIAVAANNNPCTPFLMLQVYREMQAADMHSAISIQMLLHDLLDQSAGIIRYAGKHTWVNKIQELLDANRDQQLTLEEMSTLFNMHPVTLSRQFHKYFSCTLGEYMRRLKIAKAITLIKSTEMPLTAIAYECGFADQSHFIKAFKQCTGMLPMPFRKM